MLKNLMLTVKRSETMGLNIFSLVLSFIALVLSVFNLGRHIGYKEGYEDAKQLHKK